jgi:simple sugar transport system ATP-binding protein
MHDGEIVGEFDPKKTTQEELGLYMAGAKKNKPLDEVADV